jgi:thioredoxin 1
MENRMNEYLISRNTIIFLLLLFVSYACNKDDTRSNADSSKQPIKADSTKITFVELGSINCIPCKMMQPVMETIKEKYGRQIKVVFYDVWKPGQKKYAQEYNIRLIPTQVFLDKSGEEIFRHEGFFPEKEIDAFLQKQGLKPRAEI